MTREFWRGAIAAALTLAFVSVVAVVLGGVSRIQHFSHSAFGLVASSGARRVVTGYDAAGKSVVLSDEPAPHTEDFGDTRYIEMWRTATSPAEIDVGMPPEPTVGPLTLAQPGGSVLRYVDFPPASGGGRRTPMHRTKTVDYGIVIEGEVVLVLDDSEVTLKPGDVVVQQGTNHAWENRSNMPARMAFVLLDGKIDDKLKAKLPAPDFVP